MEKHTNFPDYSKYLKVDLYLHTRAYKEFSTSISHDTKFAEAAFTKGKENIHQWTLQNF